MFYRKTWEEMVKDEDGPSFFALAFRVPAYAGVMQARFSAEAEPSTPTPASGQRDDVTAVESDRTHLELAGMGDLIEWGGG